VCEVTPIPFLFFLEKSTYQTLFQLFSDLIPFPNRFLSFLPSNPINISSNQNLSIKPLKKIHLPRDQVTREIPH
jgi:hypothetical protein